MGWMGPPSNEEDAATGLICCCARVVLEEDTEEVVAETLKVLAIQIHRYRTAEVARTARLVQGGLL